jgi:hypothetical protein
VVGHSLVSHNPAGVTRQSLGKDLLEVFAVLRFLENGRPGIASVQGVINPARFVCTFGSSHLGVLSELNSPEKSPDTFYSPQGGRVRVEVYLDCGDEAKNEQLFDCLLAEKAAIEKDLGAELKRACRIAIYRDGEIDADSETLAEIRKWAIDQLLRFKKVFPERIKRCV